MEDFEAWVHARAAVLARSAYLLTGDLHLAEDLVQDTLARVAQHWAKVSREGTPDAYARRVMHNLAVDRWRRRRVRPVEVVGDVGPDRGPATGDGPEGRLVLGQALARLTPRQRAVLSLRFYDDLTEVESARVLGCSPNTAKSQARQALRRLRELAPDLLASFETGARR